MDDPNRIYLPPGPLLYWSVPIWAIVNKLLPDIRTGSLRHDEPSISLEAVYVNQAARQDIFDRHRQELRDLHTAGKLRLLSSNEEPAYALTVGSYIPRLQIVEYLVDAGFNVRQDPAKQKIKFEEAFPRWQHRRKDEWLPEEIVAIAIRHDALNQDPATNHFATQLLAGEYGISEERIRQLLRRPEAKAIKAELARSREPKLRASVFNPEFVGRS